MTAIGEEIVRQAQTVLEQAANVREIAQRHGAQVALHDGANGRGLRVCVEFPA